MKKDPPKSADLSHFGKLAEYNRKRHFGVTPEPQGKLGRAKRKSLEFVVQKHRASRLHYDFRLEHDGVMQTEDHPIDYNQFEGVIPEGEYGGGTVMIWDQGTWEPEVDDVGKALAKGDVKFKLNGKKLRGSWVLVRMRPRQWLLIKHRDEAASTNDITAAKSRSAVSRRSLAGIARKAGATARQLAQAEEADKTAAVPHE